VFGQFICLFRFVHARPDCRLLLEGAFLSDSHIFEIITKLVEFVRARPVIRISLWLLTAFLLGEISGHGSMFCQLLIWGVVAWTKLFIRFIYFFASDSDHVETITKLLLIFISAWTVCWVCFRFNSTSLILEDSSS
jgi:hypothetical protein